MSAADWLTRNVSRLTAGEKSLTEKTAAGHTERAQAATKKIATGAGLPERSTHERLQATLSHKDEALSPRVLRRTLQELQAIILLANNRWLAQAIADLRKILKLARLQQLHAPGRLAQSLSEHMTVFAALKSRDSEGAEAAMRTHLTRQREALRDLSRNLRSRVAS